MLETGDGGELASIYRKLIMVSAQFLEKVHLGLFRFLCAWPVTVLMFGLWGSVAFIFPRHDLAGDETCGCVLLSVSLRTQSP